MSFHSSRTIYRQIPGLELHRNRTEYEVRCKDQKRLCRLNEQAAVVFELCNGARFVRELYELLAEVYPGVELTDIARGADDALRELAAAGLIVDVSATADSNRRSERAHDAANYVVRRNDDCAQLFIFFKGIGDGLMMSPLEFLVETRVHDRNLVLLRDPHRSNYRLGLEPEPTNFQSVIDRLRETIDSLREIREIHVIGTSAGAFPAILAGLELRARTVYALALVQAPVKAQETVVSPQYPSLARLLGEHRGETRIRLYFNSSFEPDRCTAESLSGLHGVSLHPLPGNGHSVADSLRDSGMLGGLFPAFRAASEPS